MKRKVKDYGQSVRARLLAIAHENGIQLEYVLLRYAFERFLWRLGESRFHDSFVLKGASAFAVWLGPFVRVTRDADMEAFGDPTPERLVAAFREIGIMPCPEDGVIFADDSYTTTSIHKQGGYPGIRVAFRAEIGGAKVAMQVDVGFGDSIYPMAEVEDYPALLGECPPRIRVYPRYSVVAEKFQAMVALDMANSRLKDFYDIWLLSERFAFDFDLLRMAIAKTFARRNTALPPDIPVALTSRFSESPAKQSQWVAFLKNGGIPENGLTLEAVRDRICSFLLPTIEPHCTCEATWIASVGWSNASNPRTSEAAPSVGRASSTPSPKLPGT